MTNSIILSRIIQAGIVPIIRSNNTNSIFICADALIQAELPILELSFSVPHTDKTLLALAKKFGDSLILGAGTICSIRDADAAIASGARFIVSPHCNEKIIHYCKSKSLTVFPGALTPTEIEKAWKCGADAVKVFPCDALGGPSYIKSLKAPFPNIRLFPCGGITKENIDLYWEAKADSLFIGSALCNMHLSESRLFDSVFNNTLLLKNKTAVMRSTPL